MKKIEIAREVVSYAAAFGSSMIIGAIASPFIPSRINAPIKWGLMHTGKFGIEGLVSNAVLKSTRAQFDEYVDIFNKATAKH